MLRISNNVNKLVLIVLTFSIISTFFPFGSGDYTPSLNVAFADKHDDGNSDNDKNAKVYDKDDDNSDNDKDAKDNDKDDDDDDNNKSNKNNGNDNDDKGSSLDPPLSQNDVGELCITCIDSQNIISGTG